MGVAKGKINNLEHVIHLIKNGQTWHCDVNVSEPDPSGNGRDLHIAKIDFPGGKESLLFALEEQLRAAKKELAQELRAEAAALEG